jgi:hypothetical protein
VGTRPSIDHDDDNNILMEYGKPLNDISAELEWKRLSEF